MGHGASGFLSIAGGIFMFFFGAIMFAIFVTASFFLVRFLLAATTAAHLYIAKNTPARDVKPTAAVQEAIAHGTTTDDVAAESTSAATIPAATVPAKAPAKAPAKPATSVPRTPNAPKSSTPKSAPKKP